MNANTSEHLAKQPGPLVTVYVTNYNYSRYLKQAIESVLEQTYQNFELIIIDDGSTDDSLNIIYQYEKRENVRVVRQSNKGLTVANNIALKLSHGKYIMRLDADDYLERTALASLVAVIESDNSLALVFPDYFEVDEQGNIIRLVQRHDFSREVSLYDQPAHGACTIVRTDALRKVGGYDEAFNRQDGYDLWLTIIDKYAVRNINEPLFYYRQHPKSLTGDEKSLLETRSRIIEKHVKKQSRQHLRSALAIIPVRGTAIDARSLPLEPLGDRCLIDWTIDEALKSKDTSEVLVTTSDVQVLDHVSSKYGDRVVCHERSVETSRINVQISAALEEALGSPNNFKRPLPKTLMVLNIESPFRNAMYMDKALQVKDLFNVDAVVGVRMDDDFFYTHNGNGLKPRSAERLRLERDDLYRAAGGITVVDTDFFYKNNAIIGGSVGHIILDQKAAFCIKTKLDWKIAGLLASV